VASLLRRGCADARPPIVSGARAPASSVTGEGPFAASSRSSSARGASCQERRQVPTRSCRWGEMRLTDARSPLVGGHEHRRRREPVAYTASETVLLLAAALVFIDGLIHVGAAVDHFDEFPFYTFAFVAIAAAQLARPPRARPSERDPGAVLGACEASARPKGAGVLHDHCDCRGAVSRLAPFARPGMCRPSRDRCLPSPRRAQAAGTGGRCWP
jgi:hypothetical protein